MPRAVIDDLDAREGDKRADRGCESLAALVVETLQDVRDFEDDELRQDDDDVAVLRLLEQGMGSVVLLLVASCQLRHEDIRIDGDLVHVRCVLCACALRQPPAPDRRGNQKADCFTSAIPVPPAFGTVVCPFVVMVDVAILFR